MFEVRMIWKEGGKNIPTIAIQQEELVIGGGSKHYHAKAE